MHLIFCKKFLEVKRDNFDTGDPGLLFGNLGIVDGLTQYYIGAMIFLTRR
jgi:hypothetical protein